MKKGATQIREGFSIFSAAIESYLSERYQLPIAVKSRPSFVYRPKLGWYAVYAGKASYEQHIGHNTIEAVEHYQREAACFGTMTADLRREREAK